MYLVVATLVTRFDFDFTGLVDGKEHFRVVSDQFILGYKGGPGLKARVFARRQS